MPIPKTIYQTFKSSKLPLLTRWHIYWMKKKNPEYDYQFYDDTRIEAFIKEEFDEETFKLYSKLNIGAAKADFFRYAILYIKGGIYLDIDSKINISLDSFILDSDSAIITLESNLIFYVQWALIYEAGHPFLKQTLENIKDNIRNNKFPHDIHGMTGPTVYTKSIKECFLLDKTIKYRELGVDYNNYFKFSYPLSKLFLYGINRNNHWKKEAGVKPVLKLDTL